MGTTLAFEAAFEKKKTKQAWNVFFSHLSWAQLAAADECRALAIELESEGRFDLADHYRVFETEERVHATTLRSLCTKYVEPDKRLKKLLRQKLAGRTDDCLDKMACLHFSLDPSFLTFLGSLHRSANDLVPDAKWADNIKTRLAPIVRDEVFHLNEGQEMTIGLARTRTPETRSRLKKRVAAHQKVVATAFQRIFEGTGVPESWLAEMNENYRTRFERSVDSLN